MGWKSKTIGFPPLGGPTQPTPAYVRSVGNVDGRRRRWIPLSVEFPFDKTGTRLQEEFGPAGLAVWVALLTAAKRAHVQGQFSYTTEEEAWRNLGISGVEFSFDEFLRVSGQLKNTRKRRRGRITDVQITAWEEWNDTQNTRPGREEKPRLSHESTSHLRATESEIDSEIEIDSSHPFFDFFKRNVRDVS